MHQSTPVGRPLKGLDSSLGFTGLVKRLSRTWELYLFVLPAVVHIFIFRYIPIYGLRIAFTDGFSLRATAAPPEWNNFAHFLRFFNSAFFWRIIRNTILISLYDLAMFPIPLFLALMINQLRNRYFQRAVQMVSFAPYFISMVVVVSMLTVFLNPRNGVVNSIITVFGGDPIFFMGSPEWGPTLFVLSNVWQQAGYAAIIYIAALSGVDDSTKEAAFCDGANKLQIIYHVEIPWIAPTIAILFILRVGRLLEVGFEKLLLMQNSLNMNALEIIDTYVYRTGILQAHYDYATAVGLLKTVVNFSILLAANRMAKRLGQESLW